LTGNLSFVNSPLGIIIRKCEDDIRELDFEDGSWTELVQFHF
jgi:hypothetical protein